MSNQGAEDVEDLQLLVSVPKYIQLQMKPLSSDVVPAQGEGVVSQLFRFRNQDIEEKDTVAKLRVLFRREDEEFDEMVMVDCFLEKEIGRLLFLYYEIYILLEGCSAH